MFVQLVVVENGKLFVKIEEPQQYHKTIMKLAHESNMSGHLAVKKIIQTVFSEFFLPGIPATKRDTVVLVLYACDLSPKVRMQEHL